MTRNSIILLVSIIVVAGGLLYYFFFFNTSTDSALLTDTTMASDAELSFITLVGKLDSITFDTSLLSDPRFTARQDIRTAVVPEQTGRKDPFAPIGK
jgi:hypothetical protein